MSCVRQAKAKQSEAARDQQETYADCGSPSELYAHLERHLVVKAEVDDDLRAKGLPRLLELALLQPQLDGVRPFLIDQAALLCAFRFFTFPLACTSRRPLGLGFGASGELLLHVLAHCGHGGRVFAAARC